ncbi:MAG: molybdopterin molybdenumtransferase MoeA, partial [Bryobacteraceae bacterium]|nr:molybdopterin molybdenumtransferase MoeA [Bryobacteraceae bacterium]
YAGVALMASVGMSEATVYTRPRVAIVATGDEIVADGATPMAHQIRNSNSHSLAAQVRLAGGEPEILPVAPDELDATAALIERGLEADLLLLSGGVSAGKYDFVEKALARVGAVLLRQGADPAGPAAGVRAGEGEVLFWTAGQSGFDNGVFRGVRTGGGGVVGRDGRSGAADDVGGIDGGFQAPGRADAVSAGGA